MKHNFNNFIVFSFQPKASLKPPKKTDLLFEEGEEEDLVKVNLQSHIPTSFYITVCENDGGMRLCKFMVKKEKNGTFATAHLCV